MDPWHSHLLASVWQWSCHYLFKAFSMSQLKTSYILHAGRMLYPTLPLLRPRNCTHIYSDTNTMTVYKYMYLQFHQQSDSVQVSTVTPSQWQYTRIYSDTDIVTVYMCLQWQQYYDIVQVSTLTTIIGQSTSIYSDNNTMTVYKCLQWQKCFVCLFV